jgi:hypothetical protein
MISPRTRFPRGRVVFIDLALLQLPADYVSMTLYLNLTVPTKHVWQINFGKYVDNPRRTEHWLVADKTVSSNATLVW